MKVTEQYSSFLRYCLLCCIRWFYLFVLVDEMLRCDLLLKPIEKYFLVLLYIMLYKRF